MEKDRLQVSFEIMRFSLISFQKAAKCKYLSERITKNGHKPKLLFSTTDSVLNAHVTLFPEPTVSLCESFEKIFTDKIVNQIRDVTYSSYFT